MKTSNFMREQTGLERQKIDNNDRNWGRFILSRSGLLKADVDDEIGVWYACETKVDFHLRSFTKK